MPAGTHMLASVRVAIVLLTLFSLTACGARSGLSKPGDDESPMDAGPAPDDGGGIDAAICGRLCSDGVFCNGEEVCDPTTSSCVAGDPPDCDDGDECTIDSCSVSADECVNTPSPRDEDRDGVGACEGDCDDTEARIRPGLPEVCDGLDNDCNGAVDEGVLSVCGDCRPGCNRVRVPDATEGWDPEGDPSAGVEVAPDGSLTLSSSRTETYFAWVANTLFGTITKIDTRDGSQSAEYDAVWLDGTNGGRMVGERCRTDMPGGNCPSRTAVDLRGAVYIANRAFFRQGTVTKIAGLESDCIDRNGNGVIDTSRDLDGDGRIERSVPGEYLGQADECLLWTVDVGPVNGVPRAVAVDSSGTVWVGLHESHTVIQLNPNDGSVMRTVALPRTGPFSRFRPYGAVGDGAGRVWIVESASGNIISIDSATGAVGSVETAASRGADSCSSSYGIAVDHRGRIWVAGFLCDYAFRYDPATDRWFEVELPNSGATRGIAADAAGRIYIASSHEFITFTPGGGVTASDPISRLTIFDADDGGNLRIFGTPTALLPGLGSTGVGLDSAGQVWLVNQDSSSATRIDPVTGAARDFPTGTDPYTYSDFTGFALRTFTAPNGFIRQVVPGCAVGPTEWEILSWDANTPPGTRVEVRVRTANSVVELGGATWIGPFTTQPSDFTMPPGPVGNEMFMELEISLFSDGDMSMTPSIRSATVQYNCPI